MKTPTDKQLGEHVLRDMQAEAAAVNTVEGKGEPKGPLYRYFRFTAKRSTCMAFLVLFGWAINVYPFWMIRKDRKLFSWISGEKREGEPSDVSVTFGLGGIDLMPYKVR